jgi:hypothetical protein
MDGWGQAAASSGTFSPLNCAVPLLSIHHLISKGCGIRGSALLDWFRAGGFVSASSDTRTVFRPTVKPEGRTYCWFTVLAQVATRSARVPMNSARRQADRGETR